MKELTCFKAYDIRGRLGSELNENIAYRIGCAYATFLDANEVVVGGDIRTSSSSLKLALSEGLRDSGVDVIDIGTVGTEEIYFATSFLGCDGGVEVTASHNPIDFNGMKLVRQNSRPISSDTGLLEIQKLAQKNEFILAKTRGGFRELDLTTEYVDHLLSYIDQSSLTPKRLVCNAGNGCAGKIIDAIENRFIELGMPIQFIKIFNEPDGLFPNGIPNPILHQNRAPTIEAVLDNKADIGLAWDGDFDRCFFVDENGRFIEGYYVVGLLAKFFLEKDPASTIIHDPRLIWNTIDLTGRFGGRAVMSKTGHAFIKERMRLENAVYGGEMSAHHYFRDFYFCDSGMIPWLLVMQLMCLGGRPLSEMVDEMIDSYPSPGEINRAIEDPSKAIDRVIVNYEKMALSVDTTDGISMDFGNWRFNLRMSNTEPLVRLNIETRGDQELLYQRRDEILKILDDT